MDRLVGDSMGVAALAVDCDSVVAIAVSEGSVGWWGAVFLHEHSLSTPSASAIVTHGCVNIPACSVCVGIGQVIGAPSKRATQIHRSRVCGTP